MSKVSALEHLKKEYVGLQRKYKLPSFDLLNREFEIERVAEHETDLLLREIRKAMTEKIIVFLRFLEMLLNPTSAPFFVLAILKNLTNVNKKSIERVYTKLCGIELAAISLDITYNEKKEVEFIKNVTREWKKMKEELVDVGKILEKAWYASTEKKEKTYFG